MLTSPRLLILALVLLVAAGCRSRGKNEEPDAQAIASEAYIYAYPMLENYKTIYGLFIQKKSPGYLGKFNEPHHKTRLLGPEFKDVVRPNNDTLYTMAALDLRSEPMVLSVPAIEKDRYYSWQLIDLYSHNFGYIGSRATGSDAGTYMIAGPGWRGRTPVGVDQVFRAETQLIVAIARVAVAGASDVADVLEIQKKFVLQPLSAYLGQEPPTAPAPLWYPDYDPAVAASAGFVGYFNFLLDLCTPQRSETALFDRFARIGIGPGQPLDVEGIAPDLREAIEAGVSAGQHEIDTMLAKLGHHKNGWSLVSGAFGDRKRMEGRHLVRAAAARFGLYGNDEEEAYYPALMADADGDPTDASQHSYVLKFEKDELPPVNSFWSITMYKLPEQLMVANPIQRYSIGDRTEGLVYGEDGSLTVYVQAESPGEDKQSNWLPAPKGPFSLQARMYWPKPEALENDYAPPPLRKRD